jgi:heat shock protein HslJ
MPKKASSGHPHFLELVPDCEGVLPVPPLAVSQTGGNKVSIMKKISLSLVIFLVIAGSMLPACASLGTSDTLKGTSWKLVSYGPTGKQSAAAAGIDTSLDFGTDGTFNGSMGCNGFGGNYEIKNGNIVFSQVISSMMACLGPQMDQERATLKVMNGTVRFQLQGNTLVIFAADGASAITLAK